MFKIYNIRVIVFQIDGYTGNCFTYIYEMGELLYKPNPDASIVCLLNFGNSHFELIIILSHPTLQKTSYYNNIFKLNKDIKLQTTSPKVKIYDSEYFFDFVLERSFLINSNPHIIIIEDGFFSHNIDGEKMKKFDTILKSNLPNITIIQEMQFLQKNNLLSNGYPYNFYFTNETSREIINSTYKTLDNINVIGAFEIFDKFSNFITNITEYDFIKYSSSCPVDNVTLIKN
jgi:hypothetical protein